MSGVYGKDIPVVKTTADVGYYPYGASWWFDDDEMPADLQALLEDESVVLPGEESVWRKVLDWVRRGR